MDVTELGITVVWHPTINVLSAVRMMALQLLRLSYTGLPVSTTMVVRPEHPEKALLPIDVTELGIVNEVSPEQPWKAPSPIDVTELGMVKEVSPEQPSKV